MMRSYKWFPHVIKMHTLAYNQVNSVAIENTIVLNIMHNIFNLRVSEIIWKDKRIISSYITYVVGWLIDWLIDLLIDWSIDWLIDWST